MASRNSSNRRAQTQDNGTHFEEPFNAQAVETANARIDLVGPLRQSNVTASQVGVALNTGIAGADGQPGVVAHSPGSIVAITYSFNAAVTAGGATAAQVQATVAPAATLTPAVKGDVVSIASQASPRQASVVAETTEIPFNKGDVLGANLTTSAGFLPVTVDLDVFLLIRWAPSDIG